MCCALGVCWCFQVIGHTTLSSSANCVGVRASVYIRTGCKYEVRVVNSGFKCKTVSDDYITVNK
jgi:hypothetical protein